MPDGYSRKAIVEWMRAPSKSRPGRESISFSTFSGHETLWPPASLCNTRLKRGVTSFRLERTVVRRREREGQTDFLIQVGLLPGSGKACNIRVRDRQLSRVIRDFGPWPLLPLSTPVATPYATFRWRTHPTGEVELDTAMLGFAGVIGDPSPSAPLPRLLRYLHERNITLPPTFPTRLFIGELRGVILIESLTTFASDGAPAATITPELLRPEKDFHLI